MTTIVLPIKRLAPVLLCLAALWGLSGVPARAEAGTGASVALTKAIKHRFDTFLTYFAEADVAPFAAGKISDREMIGFAMMYLTLHRSDLAHPLPEGGGFRLDADAVSRTAERFFGRRIRKHQTVGRDAVYTGHAYRVPITEWEEMRFAQVVRLRRLDRDTFAADAVIYAGPASFAGDPDAPPGEWQRLPNAPKPDGRVRAVIRQVTIGGKPHLVLISWTALK